MEVTTKEQVNVLSFILMQGMSLMYKDGYAFFMPSELASAASTGLPQATLKVMGDNDLIFAYKSEDRSSDLSGVLGLLIKIQIALSIGSSSLKELLDANKKWMTYCINASSSSHAFTLFNKGL